jgi:hypothetical protein
MRTHRQAQEVIVGLRLLCQRTDRQEYGEKRKNKPLRNRKSAI